MEIEREELIGIEVEEGGDHTYRLYGETITFSILFLFALLTNIPLCYIYVKSKHIRSSVDKFLFNMLLADALCVTILLPTILTDLLLPEQFHKNLNIEISSRTQVPILNETYSEEFNSTFSPSPLKINILQKTLFILSSKENGFRSSWACSYKKSLLSGISSATLIASLQIAVERYLAVLNPLHYHEFLNRAGVLFTSSAGTLVALGSALLAALDPCQPVFPGCVFNTRSLADSAWWPSYTLCHVALFFILPILLMTFIYIRIWWEARRQRAKMNSHYNLQQPFYIPVPIVPSYTSSIASADIIPHTPISISHSVDDHHRVHPAHHKHRFHIPPLLLRLKLIERLIAPRMDRAARVAICTLFVNILCWGPYYFVEASHAIQSIIVNEPIRRNQAWKHYETIIPLLFASLHPLLAPFFYAYRYERVREEVFKTFGIGRPPCSAPPPPHISSLIFHDKSPCNSPSSSNLLQLPPHFSHSSNFQFRTKIPPQFSNSSSSSEFHITNIIPPQFANSSSSEFHITNIIPPQFSSTSSSELHYNNIIPPQFSNSSSSGFHIENIIPPTLLNSSSSELGLNNIIPPQYSNSSSELGFKSIIPPTLLNSSSSSEFGLKNIIPPHFSNSSSIEVHYKNKTPPPSPIAPKFIIGGDDVEVEIEKECKVQIEGEKSSSNGVNLWWGFRCGGQRESLASTSSDRELVGRKDSRSSNGSASLPTISHV